MGCEQCSASFCLRIFSGFDLFFRRLPLVLGFCHSIVAILTCASVLLTCHLVGLNAGYPGGGGTSAPCSTGIAWAGRGISKAVA